MDAFGNTAYSPDPEVKQINTDHESFTSLAEFDLGQIDWANADAVG